MTRLLRGLLVLGLLIAVAASLSGHLGELLPLDISAGSTQTAVAAPARMLEAADQDVNAAVQQAIQRSNDEQVQAISSRDSSLMADTVTSDHYRELVRVNQDLHDSGVSRINLLRLEWGPIAVDRSTASATPYEPWRSTFSHRTTQQSRRRKDYQLELR